MKYVFILLSSLCFSNIVYAASFFVDEPHLSEANPELSKSLKTLVMSSVVQSGSKTNQDEKSADFTLRTDLLRLGGAYILTISKFKKNEMVFSSKYKAASLDELDDVSDRGVRAVILGTQVKKDTRVGEVSTRDENKMQTRVRSFNTRYFGFGAASLMNMGNSKVAYNIAFGHFWEVTPRTQIKLVGEFFATSDWTTYLADAQLGLNLFLNDEDSSPYIGAGLGVAGSGSSSSSVTSISGFSGGVGLGYQFFRTSSTQFDVYVGYNIEFVNNSIGNPGAFGARIGIHY